jgi:tetraacyldisaccharide-1-P 4'-kinase
VFVFETKKQNKNKNYQTNNRKKRTANIKQKVKLANLNAIACIGSNEKYKKTLTNKSRIPSNVNTLNDHM